MSHVEAEPTHSEICVAENFVVKSRRGFRVYSFTPINTSWLFYHFFSAAFHTLSKPDEKLSHSKMENQRNITGLLLAKYKVIFESKKDAFSIIFSCPNSMAYFCKCIRKCICSEHPHSKKGGRVQE